MKAKNDSAKKRHLEPGEKMAIYNRWVDEERMVDIASLYSVTRETVRAIVAGAIQHGRNGVPAEEAQAEA